MPADHGLVAVLGSGRHIDLAVAVQGRHSPPCRPASPPWTGSSATVTRSCPSRGTGCHPPRPGPEHRGRPPVPPARPRGRRPRSGSAVPIRSRAAPPPPRYGCGPGAALAAALTAGRLGDATRAAADRTGAGAHDLPEGGPSDLAQPPAPLAPPRTCVSASRARPPCRDSARRPTRHRRRPRGWPRSAPRRARPRPSRPRRRHAPGRGGPEAEEIPEQRVAAAEQRGRGCPRRSRTRRFGAPSRRIAGRRGRRRRRCGGAQGRRGPRRPPPPP